MQATPVVEVRNLQFATDESVPRFWHGGRKSITAFYNNLSVFFPPGERFFIASVKAHRDFLTDPKLAAEARAFYAQEGIHSREHVRYNAMLREQGYPVEAMESRVAKLLAGVARRSPARMQLAVTCALEHFTALMAEMILRYPENMDGADLTMKRLWRWHAAEENEHKGVAFDVFKAAGGTYLERALAMIGATVIFWSKVLEQQVRLMHHDGTLYSPSEWYALFRYLFVKPGGLTRLFVPYLSYFRPSFHPWQHDSSDMLEAWKAELASDPSYGAAH
ncbi:MAG TPA: metal-dependent hydrolase [Polyangiales bacterium]